MALLSGEVVVTAYRTNNIVALTSGDPYYSEYVMAYDCPANYNTEYNSNYGYGGYYIDDASAGGGSGFSYVGLSGFQIELANKILINSKVFLFDEHVSTKLDCATPLQNMQNIADGTLAYTSPLGDAQGSIIPLSYGLLNGIDVLSQSFAFSISELAGGDHAASSAHYLGIAMDVNIVNGIPVKDMTEDQRNAFHDAARDAGAQVIFDPLHDDNNCNHQSHFHIQFF